MCSSANGCGIVIGLSQLCKRGKVGASRRKRGLILGAAETENQGFAGFRAPTPRLKPAGLILGAERKIKALRASCTNSGAPSRRKRPNSWCNGNGRLRLRSSSAPSRAISGEPTTWCNGNGNQGLAGFHAQLTPAPETVAPTQRWNKAFPRCERKLTPGLFRSKGCAYCGGIRLSEE